MDSKTARIRALNDELRQNFAEGLAVMTPGIAALGGEAVARIVKTVAVFDDFCHANDPHQEHDFGAFGADGYKVFFKIDYYDESLTRHLSRSCRAFSDQARDHHHARRRILRTGRARNTLAARPTENWRRKATQVSHPPP